MRAKRKTKQDQAIELLDKLVHIAGDGDPGLQLRALEIRDRLVLPMSKVLDKIPGNNTSQKARMAGVSRNAYYNWLNGVSRPSGAQAERLAQLTGYPVEDIKGYTLAPSPYKRAARLRAASRSVA